MAQLILGVRPNAMRIRIAAGTTASVVVALPYRAGRHTGAASAANGISATLNALPIKYLRPSPIRCPGTALCEEIIDDLALLASAASLALYLA
jgi:hypothetical protein